MEDREQAPGIPEQFEPADPENGGDEDGIEIIEDELAGVRDLILKAYPEIVPELLEGESVDALLASVPAAREAYSRVAATVQEQLPPPIPIPTGSGRRPAMDVEGLSPEAKIRVGMRERDSAS